MVYWMASVSRCSTCWASETPLLGGLVLVLEVVLEELLELGQHGLEHAPAGVGVGLDDLHDALDLALQRIAHAAAGAVEAHHAGAHAVDQAARRVVDGGEEVGLGHRHAQHRHLQPREPDAHAGRDAVFGEDALEQQRHDLDRGALLRRGRGLLQRLLALVQFLQHAGVVTCIARCVVGARSAGGCRTAPCRWPAPARRQRRRAAAAAHAGPNSGRCRPTRRFRRPARLRHVRRCAAAAPSASSCASLRRRRPCPVPHEAAAHRRVEPGLRRPVAAVPSSARVPVPLLALQPSGAFGVRARAADEGPQVDLGQHAAARPASGWSRGRPPRPGARTPRAAWAASRASWSSVRPAARQASNTMRASTCARSRSCASSSVRPSSVATRERRSANSQDARSMMASASREVTISSSIVSSSTSVRPSRAPGSGRSTGREADAPLCSAGASPPRCRGARPGRPSAALQQVAPAL
jgi:hypothetical protein